MRLGKILIELDRTRDQRSEVQRVIQVRDEFQPVRQLSIFAIDDQVQDSKENVGESNRNVSRSQKGCVRKERIPLQPDKQRDGCKDQWCKCFGELAALHQPHPSIADEQESHKREK